MAIITKLYNFKNRIIFAYNDFYYFMNKQGKKAELDSYHNKYQGQACFIVGNGPSLNSRDLNLIKKEGYITFAANKIYRIFKETDWRPVHASDRGYGAAYYRQ